MMHDAGELTIGELARRIGRPASAIRYYESVGVLPEPDRVSGRRRYPPDTVRRLAVIDTLSGRVCCCRRSESCSAHGPGDPAAIERLRDVAERKLPELAALIERAEVVKRWRQAAVACQCPTLEDCPLFDSAGQIDRLAP